MTSAPDSALCVILVFNGISRPQVDRDQAEVEMTLSLEQTGRDSKHAVVFDLSLIYACRPSRLVVCHQCLISL